MVISLESAGYHKCSCDKNSRLSKAYIVLYKDDTKTIQQIGKMVVCCHTAQTMRYHFYLCGYKICLA